MTKSALIKALSGFWHRFFADIGELEQFYLATEELIGRVYLDLMGSVLGSSLAETPLAQPEAYRLWEIADSAVSRVSGRWRVAAPVAWRSVRYLQDSVLTPRKVLSPRAGFDLGPSAVFFPEDPRRIFSEAAVRRVAVEVGGVLKTSNAAELGAGDRIIVDGGREFQIRHVSGSEIAFTPESRVNASVASVTWRRKDARPDAVAYTGELVATTRASEQITAVWAIEAQVDPGLLARNYGELLGYVRPSSEEYRRLLQGLLRLNVTGPSKNRMEDGLAAFVGLPTVYRDGERVVSVNPDVLTTDSREYRKPVGVGWRSGLVPGATLRAFQSLTDGVRVYDDVTNPGWWIGITVPDNLMPNTPPEGRVVSPDLKENRIGVKYGGIIGDPGAAIGARWRYGSAYLATQNTFRHHLFGVYVNPVVLKNAADFDDVKKIVWACKPANAVPYFWEPVTLRDEVVPLEALTT